MKLARYPRIAPGTLVRALLTLGVLGFAYLLGNTGCSSGAICYRNTDCPYGSDCKQGQCVRRNSSEAGMADTGAAGEADVSQTPDAN